MQPGISSQIVSRALVLRITVRQKSVLDPLVERKLCRFIRNSRTPSWYFMHLLSSVIV